MGHSVTPLAPSSVYVSVAAGKGVKVKCQHTKLCALLMETMPVDRCSIGSEAVDDRDFDPITPVGNNSGTY